MGCTEQQRLLIEENDAWAAHKSLKDSGGKGKEYERVDVAWECGILTIGIGWGLDARRNMSYRSGSSYALHLGRQLPSKTGETLGATSWAFLYVVRLLPSSFRYSPWFWVRRASVRREKQKAGYHM